MTPVLQDLLGQQECKVRKVTLVLKVTLVPKEFKVYKV